MTPLSSETGSARSCRCRAVSVDRSIAVSREGCLCGVLRNAMRRVIGIFPRRHRPSRAPITPSDSRILNTGAPVVYFGIRSHSTLAAILLSAVSVAGAQTSTPVYTPGKLTPAQQVARDVFQELIEINTR